MKAKLLHVIFFSLAATFVWVVFAINLTMVLVDVNVFQRSGGDLSYVMIFGGGMQEDGTQNAFQRDRVIRGVEVYKTGNVNKILITGDDGGNHDDEVHAMELLAIQLGVPRKDIVVDPHGYRTYESCYRARAVYGIRKAIVVSQAFHLPRILYLCRGMGVDVAGVAANLSDYGDGKYTSQIREVLARVKAWWQLEVTKPNPRSLEK